VIDTGIDLDHPDLNVNNALSATFVPRTSSANDDNGHGSHVAGTIAAINNTIGVVGVAAGAEVVAVKVLDRRGSGAYSTIIAGVDYVSANATSGDVANMSLGGPAYTELDNAVLAAAGKGIKFALAAGNESTLASTKSPARVNHANVFTVSAVGTNDAWAYFSNYGNPPVDFAAPGVSIYSCYKGGGYTTMSGTSMASPHVAGLLLWGNVGTDGNAVGDPDGNADPIAHK
jgi:subtilisin family serine protease